jgi:Zn-dependent protease with chaperone function
MNALRLAAVLILGVCVAAAGAAHGRDYGSMYDDALLASRQKDYRDVVMWNLQNVFLAKLTVDERRRLQSLSVDFPLRGPERGLHEYFSERSGRVVMPVMSIRFLADLALAYAWLDANGYTMETVTDYISMLKYQDAARFGGRYPDPVGALGIPPQAGDNPRVATIFEQILNHSVSFILLHEMGHVLFQHPGYGPGVTRARARENEDQADRFALEVLRRAGQPVSGLLFFFLSAAHAVDHRADFSSDAEYQGHLGQQTHPLTSDRMARLAQYLREHATDYGRLQNNPARAAAAIRWTADAIDKEVRPVLADPDQQRLMGMRGRNMTLAGLAPRKPGEPMAVTSPPSGPARAFHGVFDGELHDGTAGLPSRVALVRQGDRVTGQYSFGTGQGEISGVVENDTLIYSWRTATDRGRGVLRSIRNGSGVEGTWGYGERDAGGGRWTGSRVR